MRWRRRDRTTDEPRATPAPGPTEPRPAPERVLAAPPPRSTDPLALRVLVVCTANVCRSPLAEVILGHELMTSGVLAVVSSAGTVGVSGLPIDERTTAWAQRYRVDLSTHQPRQLTHPLIIDDGRDLILTMSRNHVREVLATEVTAIDRTFTLKEIVRRSATAPRARSESVIDWVHRMGAARRPAELQGDRRSDDIIDPYGRSDETFRASALEIEQFCAALVSAMTTTKGSSAPRA